MINIGGSTLLLVTLVFGTCDLQKQLPAISQNKFYCNVKALTVAERTHHKELTTKLMAERKESVETPTGYEFQFNPKTVALAELADWVAAESRCCPFLDFHIDVDAEGNLLCLRLTGAEGVKAFIQSEFAVKTNR